MPRVVPYHHAVALAQGLAVGAALEHEHPENYTMHMFTGPVFSETFSIDKAGARVAGD